MEMIADVPPIALHQRTAVCYGGTLVFHVLHFSLRFL
jgi:hypothetical protein